MKRITALLMTILIVMGTTFVFSANAQKNEEVDKNIYVSKDGKYKYRFVYEDMWDYDDYEDIDVNLGVRLRGVNIVEYIDKENLTGRYVLPREIDGYKVCSVGEKAFVGAKMKTLIIKKEWITIGKKAFYNCTNLKNVYIPQNVEIFDKAFGFYYDNKVKKEKKVRGFAFRVKEEVDAMDWYDNLKEYIDKYKFKLVFYLNSSNLNVAREIFWAPGYEYHIKIDGKSVKGWKSTDKEVVSVSNKGNVKILNEGYASVKVKLSDGTIFKRRMRVDDNFDIEVTRAPYYNYKYRPNRLVKVKKGKTTKLKLFGKVHSIKNVYSNTKTAGFVETNDDYSLKIKGYKKGKTTLKVKINGVINVKIKVHVV